MGVILSLCWTNSDQKPIVHLSEPSDLLAVATGDANLEFEKASRDKSFQVLSELVKDPSTAAHPASPRKGHQEAYIRSGSVKLMRNELTGEGATVALETGCASSH